MSWVLFPKYLIQVLGFRIGAIKRTKAQGGPCSFVMILTVIITTSLRLWMEIGQICENQQKKNRNCKVIDLAAHADIEDIILLDSESVFKFIGIAPVPIPTKGKKGKRKMKMLFRMKGNGSAYHEGKRAEPLIQSLDFEKIMSKSTIPFFEIENKCFK